MILFKQRQAYPRMGKALMLAGELDEADQAYRLGIFDVSRARLCTAERSRCAYKYVEPAAFRIVALIFYLSSRFRERLLVDDRSKGNDMTDQS